MGSAHGDRSSSGITLAPALTITYEEMDMAIELLDQLFQRVRRK